MERNGLLLYGAFFYGIALCITKFFKQHIDNLNSIWNWFVTFCFINITWVFFRAENTSQALLFMKKLLLPNNFTLGEFINSFRLPEIKIIQSFFPDSLSYFIRYIIFFFLFIFAFYACLNMKNTNERIEKFKPNILTSIIVVILLVWSIISFSGLSEFIYFGF